MQLKYSEKPYSSLRKKGLLHKFKKSWQLQFIFLPGLIYYLLFRYVPMYGIIIAFKNFGIYKGIMGSEWVGTKHFVNFLTGPDFSIMLRNTFFLGIYSLIWTFPFPILFAVFLNELRGSRLKKIIQTTSYLPALLSVVVVCSMTIDFLSPSRGIINNLLAAMGMERQYFMAMPKFFRSIYIATDIWQSMGYNAIIYIAALSAVDSQLYEAAKIDGCGRLRSIWHISLPGIMPTIVTLFILKSGQIFRIGFEKVLLLYNPMTYEVADIFSTFVYRKGIVESNYSFATAVGLFESVVALTILLITNYASKKLDGKSLW